MTSLNFSSCGLLHFLAFPHVEETTLMGDVPGLGVLDMEDGPGLEVSGMEVIGVEVSDFEVLEESVEAIGGSS